MSRLHQIQIKYEALEDRALLRMATTDGREFRFWITRRYAKLLGQALARSAARLAHRHTPSDPVTRDAVVSFQRDAALAKADFASEYREQVRERPLGDAPVLLARVRCTPRQNGLTTLALHPLRGHGIEVQVDPTLLHSLVKLLADASAAGEWDLPMQVAAAAAAPGGRIN